MSAVPGRVICSRCGANNFETQAACWKCGVALASSPAPVLSSSVPGAPSPAAYRPTATVDPSVALWCGIALAVFFPAIAVPAGLIFMMLDDRRRLEVGRITLIAGIVSTVVHLIFTYMLFQSLTTQLVRMVPSLIRSTQQPGLNSEVGDGGLKIPGYPGAGLPRTTAPPISTEPDVPFPDPPRPR